VHGVAVRGTYATGVRAPTLRTIGPESTVRRRSRRSGCDAQLDSLGDVNGAARHVLRRALRTWPSASSVRSATPRLARLGVHPAILEPRRADRPRWCRQGRRAENAVA